MYPIDFDTCTAIDIIKRSVVCHPSLFREALVASKQADFDYAKTIDRTHEAAIARSVLARANATNDAISAIDIEDFDFFKTNLSAGIIALNIACKLQVLPPHVRSDATARTW
jgi:hypothetical protein